MTPCVDVGMESKLEHYHEWVHDAYCDTQQLFEKCSVCKSDYLIEWEEVSVSKLDDDKIFCSASCRDAWDADNAWNYGESI